MERQQIVHGHAGNTRRRRTWYATVVLVSLLAMTSAASAQASYTVRPGDSLGHIAERHDTTVAALMEANGILDPNRIRAGDVLDIPAPDAAPDTAPDAAGTGGATLHVVRPGEALATIAQRYGVSSAELREWNGLGDDRSVWAGSRLSVSGPAAPDLTTGEPNPGPGERTHDIAPGETLLGIALRYGTSVDELARDNGITDPGRIAVGETLTISGSGGSGWHCPVSDHATFVNDFGMSKPSGRFHDGVDLYAALGTPVVAPVAGHVEQLTGPRAGLQFTLRGDDGHTYIGTHLDAFGASGQVQAGEVIGTVGSSGNARGTPPHLHFEIHLDGTHVVNPHPTLLSACK